MGQKGIKQDVSLIQLSKNNIAITFNKRAIAGMREGATSGIKMKVGRGREIRFVFMRDSTYRARMKEFRAMRYEGLKPWYKRMFNFMRKNK